VKVFIVEYTLANKSKTSYFRTHIDIYINCIIYLCFNVNFPLLKFI